MSGGSGSSGGTTPPLSPECARRLLSEIPVVLYTCAAEAPFPTTFITANVQELYGYDAREVLADGEFWVKHVLPEDRGAVRRGLARLGVQPSPLEYRFRCADGEHRWLRDTVKVVCGPDGKSAEIVGCIVDITDRKRFEHALEKTQTELRDRVADLVEANEQLRAAEARLRSVTDNAPGFILAVDRDGIILFINRTLESLSQEEVVGSSVYTWQTPEYHDRVRTALDGVFKTGQPDGFETEATGDEEGEQAWYESSVAPVIVDGEVTSAIIIATDVTERRKAEVLAERVRALQTELEHAARLSTIGEMTASVAHELSQPLTAITQFSGACLKLLETTEFAQAAERVRTHLDRSMEQALRAREIVQSLGDFGTRRDPESIELDVNATVREVLPIFELDSKRKGTGVKLELDASAPRVRADRLQLQQVLINLIRNAMEACAESPGEEPCVRVRTEIVPDDRVRVLVSDDGPGLPVDDPEELFRAFFTTKPAGMGLGLSISRSIVESSLGTLRARNRESGGAEFWFELPLV